MEINVNVHQKTKNSQLPVAYACDPSCLGGARSGGSFFQTVQAKKFMRPLSHKLIMAHPNNGSKLKIRGSWSRKPGQKGRP
jgi:hypothetical protein